MSRVGVALIGYGFAGRTFHAPVIAAVEALELRAVVSSQAEEVRRDLPGVAVLADPGAALADPAIELVVVATPNLTHHPLARRALEAGKHVVVEKPAAVRAAEVAELEGLAAGRGLALAVYHNRRWDGDFLTVRRLVAEGALGAVSTFESRFDRFRPAVRDRWRERPEPGSGTLYDLGSHLIDQALHLFGRPRTVTADVGAQRAGALATDYFHLVLGYGRLRALLHGGSLVAEPPLRFAVHGDRGSFLKQGLDPQEEALKAGARPGAPGWGEEPEERHGTLTTVEGERASRARVPTLPGSYPAFYEAMARAVREGAPPPVPAAEGRAVLEVIEAATRSSEEGRTVEL